MPAETRILFESVARRHVPHAVAEQSAEVSDLLLERRCRRVRIVRGVEQEGMPALRAHVFVAPVAVGELLVIVLPEKARQRMTDARSRPVFRQIVRSTPAPPPLALSPFESMVINVMSPNEARQLGQIHDIPS